MPGIDGFDVLNNIPEKERPLIVFITAYDQFAVKAFEYHALDYLLKPYSDDRFVEMIERIKKYIHQQKTINQLEKVDRLSRELLQKRKDVSDLMILEAENENKAEGSRLLVKESGKIHLIPLGKIRYIEAYDYYIKLHTAETFILVRMPLKVMERQLPGNLFIRIHRSFIINLLFLKRVEKTSSGDYQAILSDDTPLKVGNTFRNELVQKLNAGDFYN
jgi:two-component system LytT family response regulator